MTDQPMLQVEDLVMVYPGGVRAVDGISFSVARGEFFGFLGPNGAGKSTTLKVLGTLLRKTSGRVTVAGYDVDRQPGAIRQNIGFALQDVGLDDLASGRDFLRLQGLLYKLPRRRAEERADELLALLGLEDAADRKVGAYSGGMRRRVDLLSALVHEPPILFLDEPTTGLDPQSRLVIWDYLKQINAEGVTIVLTTQIMEEADRLCRRIAIIDEGKIVARGTPDSLKDAVGGDVVSLTVATEDGADGPSDPDGVRALVTAQSYVQDATWAGDCLQITVDDGGSAAAGLMRTLNERGVPVASVSVSEPTLDDVFLKFTGRSIRSDAGSGSGGDALFRPFLGLKNR